MVVRTFEEEREMERRMSVTAQKVCLAAGPVMVVLLVVGWIVCAQWLPAPGPDESSEGIARMYQENKFGLQLGFVLMIFGATFFGVWGAAMTMWTRKAEASFPVLTYVQLVMLGAGTAIFIILYIPWALAAFRADLWSAETIHMLHEFGWFMFLFDVMPFSVWMVALGLGILWTPSTHQLLPRWAGYYCIVEGFLILPALLIIFFYEGPYAYNGMLGIWWPLLTFTLWVPVMTVLCWKAINRQVAIDEAAGIGVHRDTDDPSQAPSGSDLTFDDSGVASDDTVPGDQLIGAR